MRGGAIGKPIEHEPQAMNRQCLVSQLQKTLYILHPGLLDKWSRKEVLPAMFERAVKDTLRMFLLVEWAVAHTVNKALVQTPKVLFGRSH